MKEYNISLTEEDLDEIISCLEDVLYSRRVAYCSISNRIGRILSDLLETKKIAEAQKTIPLPEESI